MAAAIDFAMCLLQKMQTSTEAFDDCMKAIALYKSTRGLLLWAYGDLYKSGMVEDIRKLTDEDKQVLREDVEKFWPEVTDRKTKNELARVSMVLMACRNQIE